MLSPQAGSQQKDILVVDDAPENLRILLDALSEQGYSVRCARSGNLAIAGSQALPPDLVLLDILMPQMDGYEVCQRLRRDARTHDVPIIFLSALDDGGDKAQAFEVGGDDYIAKPFSIIEVLARVRHQLERRHRQAQLRQELERYRLAGDELQTAYSFTRAVINSLPDGIAALKPVKNEQGVVTDFQSEIANPAFWQLVSDAATAVLAETEETLQTLIAQYSSRELFEVWLQALEFDDSIKRELLCPKDDQQQWLEVFVAKLQDSVVTLLRDITEAKAHISTLEATKQELYKLATTDTLTQVGNRYQFDSYFAREWQRSLREQQPLALLIADIDKFKQFNDICGHSVGDRCLQAVAQVLQASVKRPTDLIARYGGEEFAIVLPNTTLPGAMRIARQIQHDLQNLRLSGVPAVECERVCISIGISCTIPQGHQSASALIDAADRALYNAKYLGGNTSCVEML